MQFPETLKPTSTMGFSTPNLGVVAVPKASASFRVWSGARLADDYGGKAALDYEGEPLFAELVILRHFQKAGWQGVWIDTYRRRTLVSLTQEVSLPPERRALLDQIAARAGNNNGCFDVFAWRDDHVAFAESKRSGRDRIRPSQVRWVAAALHVGVPLESLLVVEWSLSHGTLPTST